MNTQPALKSSHLWSIKIYDRASNACNIFAVNIRVGNVSGKSTVAMHHEKNHKVENAAQVHCKWSNVMAKHAKLVKIICAKY
jgi:hypothetical protein